MFPSIPLCVPQQVSLPLRLLLERSCVVTHEQRNIKVIVVSQPLQVLIGARAETRENTAFIPLLRTMTKYKIKHETKTIFYSRSSVPTLEKSLIFESVCDPANVG